MVLASFFFPLGQGIGWRSNEQILKLQQEAVKGRDRKAKSPSEPLVTRSRPDLKMEVDEVPRATGRFNFDCVAQEQISEDLVTWTPP